MGDPQSGEIGPCLQRTRSNHFLATVSSGNLRSSSMIVMPLRSACSRPFVVWEMDWLAIHQVRGDELRLVRTGTHSDRFDG